MRNSIRSETGRGVSVRSSRAVDRRENPVKKTKAGGLDGGRCHRLSVGSAGSRPVNVAAGVVAFAFFVLGWCGGGGARAKAGVIFVSQQRSVYASALGSSQSFTAPDFGPFDRTASASSTMGQGSTGQASQHSVLDPQAATLVSLSGSVSAHGTSGFGSSTLNVVFDVADETIPFELTGVGSTTSGMPDLHSTISLTRDGATTLVQWQPSEFPPDVLDFIGALEPGRYTLSAAFSAANAPGFTASNGYAVNLLVPEPAGMAGMAGMAGAVAATGLLLRRPRCRSGDEVRPRARGDASHLRDPHGPCEGGRCTD